MSERSRRYRAFISYSQKDKAHARRLHQALERHRLPKGVEAAGTDRKTRKLGRFFRDDEEMGAATDLGAALQGAIADAENLIVVCSPNAAQSKWVNEEIIHFKRTGRADKIFAVVVAGVPHSADEHECFPPALRFVLDTDGAPTDQQAEPLAVDVRKERFARVLTRVVAGLVQLPFDALWKREQRRATAQAVTLSLSLLFLTLLVGGAVTQRIWYPRVDAYWRYSRHAHSTEELIALTPGDKFQDCQEGSTDCPVMVVIPEGTFLMGDAPRQTTDERGQVAVPDLRSRISISRFAVSEHEVTFDDWRTCVAGGGCRGASEPSDSGWGREDRPVINITWEDAQDYALWLSQMTGRHYRLLTDAEWEYAARGVTSADDARNGDEWSFGNDESQLGDYAWFSDNSDGKNQRVGTKRANPFGLFDMHGNVWEWVQDCYTGYGPTDGSAIESDVGTMGDSREQSSCSARVARGGAVGYTVESTRSAMRAAFEPASRGSALGFRIARTL